MKTFEADLASYNELDLDNLAQTARLVLADAALNAAGLLDWAYKGFTPAEARSEMSAVLTVVKAERKRRAANGEDEHIMRLGLDEDEEDEDIGRGSR